MKLDTSMNPKDENSCVAYLKALSDGTRWEIMRVLSNASESLCLGEISRTLELSKYNASRHVRILCDAGLITVIRDGRFKRISIAPAWMTNWQNAKAPGTLDLGCCRFDFSKYRKAARKSRPTLPKP